MTAKEKKLNNYKVVLEMAGIKHIKEAKTIDLALEALGLKWNNIKAKGIITVSRNKHSYEHLFYVPVLKRIFANKLTRALWAKRLGYLLKETN